MCPEPPTSPVNKVCTAQRAAGGSVPAAASGPGSTPAGGAAGAGEATGRLDIGARARPPHSPSAKKAGRGAHGSAPAAVGPTYVRSERDRVAEPKPAAVRLAELRDLLSGGLISPEEHAALRTRLLDAVVAGTPVPSAPHESRAVGKKPKASAKAVGAGGARAERVLDRGGDRLPSSKSKGKGKDAVP